MRRLTRLVNKPEEQEEDVRLFNHCKNDLKRHVRLQEVL